MSLTVPTTLGTDYMQLLGLTSAPPARNLSYALSMDPGVQAAPSAAGGVTSAASATPWGAIAQGAGDVLGGITSALLPAIQRKQMEKFKLWQIAQAKANLAPTALAAQGKYINPYSQQDTDAYHNAVMGNLLAKLGGSQLAQWGVNAAPVSSAGETGSTANQLAQYSQGNPLLAKYGYQGF